MMFPSTVALTDSEVGIFSTITDRYDSEVGIEILGDYDSLIGDGMLADTAG